MARAWQTIDAVDSERGRLELRQRGDGDYLIALGGRVLMNSHHNRSELALGELAARCALEVSRAPRVLISGLGMGCTLRAALDALPPEASVVVAELTPLIVDWCRGPLARICGDALADARVAVELGDVARPISRAAAREIAAFDAISLDLDEGPHHARDARRDPIFGDAALRTAAAALTAGGAFVVWSEHRDAGFEARLRSARLSFEVLHPGRGGLRHAVYVARR